MANVIFDWIEFDNLVIEMDSLQALISVTNLYVAEQDDESGKALNAIYSLTNRIYLDLLEKQKQIEKARSKGE